MSNLSTGLALFFSRAKRELNRQFDRYKPDIIAAVKAEVRRAREKGVTEGDDVVKDLLVQAVERLNVFGPATFLVSSLIMSLKVKGKSLNQIEAEVIKKIQGARL